MLALTRRIGEEVVIGDPRNPLGVIRIMEIHGDKVRLSFDFPKDMQINRRELAEQKARQQAVADEGAAEPDSSSPQGYRNPHRPKE
jgi:carbon storage regulator CsrA